MTWGIDGSRRAIDKARAKASHRADGAPPSFLVADALELSRLGLGFESVLDCGLFHTFDDRARVRYVASLAAVVTPGGRLHLLCFSDREPDGWGPRRVTRSEIENTFADSWRVEAIEPERFATRVSDAGAHAWLAIVERR